MKQVVCVVHESGEGGGRGGERDGMEIERKREKEREIGRQTDIEENTRTWPMQ
jgi:hypothetical protein